MCVCWKEKRKRERESEGLRSITRAILLRIYGTGNEWSKGLKKSSVYCIYIAYCLLAREQRSIYSSDSQRYWPHHLSCLFKDWRRNAWIALGHDNASGLFFQNLLLQATLIITQITTCHPIFGRGRCALMICDSMHGPNSTLNHFENSIWKRSLHHFWVELKKLKFSNRKLISLSHLVNEVVDDSLRKINIPSFANIYLYL